MPAELICSCHSGLMNNDFLLDEETTAWVGESLAKLKAAVRAFEPDVIVQFGSDHNSGVSLKVMPPFMVGLRATTLGDFNTTKGALTVPETVARDLVAYLHDGGVDVASSYKMLVDHGFTMALDHVVGSLDAFPVIPIFTNCGGDLRPPLHRSLDLGTLVGRFFRDQQPDQRVLFLGSGGLSHDPPLPVFLASPADVQERMIEGTDWTEERLVQRNQKTIDAGREFARGEGPLQALNPAWDQRVLELLVHGQLEELSCYKDQDIIHDGGRGGSEIRNWLSAFAALRAYATSYETPIVDYRQLPAWVAGFAIAHSVPTLQPGVLARHGGPSRTFGAST